ncbi:hypothetical protein ACFL23_03165 [Patescibacteria group bacterium]
MQKKLLKISFLCSLGVFGYILLVSWIINNGDKIFGDVDTLWGPVMFLMLFVFSALITALLVLGYPIWLYLEKEKKDAVKLLFYNVAWLFIFLVVVFGVKVL